MRRDFNPLRLPLRAQLKVVLVGFAVVFPLSLLYVQFGSRGPSPASEALLAEFDQFLEQPATRITIRSLEASRNPFEVSISDRDRLRQFAVAAESADGVRYFWGGPVFESVVILENIEGSERYFGKVHEGRPSDLVLSRQPVLERSEGAVTYGRPVQIRIPGLGAWIMESAPAGVLRAERER